MWTLSRSNVNSKELNDVGVSIERQQLETIEGVNSIHIYDTDLGIIGPLTADDISHRSFLFFENCHFADEIFNPRTSARTRGPNPILYKSLSIDFCCSH